MSSFTRRFPGLLVFSDLDGTLLDARSYAPDAALGAVAMLRRRGIPLVFCSSKTRAEQEPYLERLELDEPFIVENGSALFLPAGRFDLSGAAGTRRCSGRYEVLEFGVEADAIRRVLERVRSKGGFAFGMFSEATPEHLVALTGLEPEGAARARQRDYSETIHGDLDEAALARLVGDLARHGLTLAPGGRFYTVTSSGSDKGRAVRVLADLFRARCGPLLTAALGDSPNDAPMLAAVDRAFLVQRPDGRWEDLSPPIPQLRRVAGIGPVGWSRAIVALLEEFDGDGRQVAP